MHFLLQLSSPPGKNMANQHKASPLLTLKHLVPLKGKNSFFRNTAVSTMTTSKSQSQGSRSTKMYEFLKTELMQYFYNERNEKKLFLKFTYLSKNHDHFDSWSVLVT